LECGQLGKASVACTFIIFNYSNEIPGPQKATENCHDRQTDRKTGGEKTLSAISRLLYIFFSSVRMGEF